MERRLAAILVADVVGYSRLVSADEEGTLRTLGAYRQIIDGLVADRHGRVFGSAGDSVVAEFASVVEAVRCATAIQEEIGKRNAELPEDRRMAYRIGVNLGDVVVNPAECHTTWVAAVLSEDRRWPHNRAALRQWLRASSLFHRLLGHDRF